MHDTDTLAESSGDLAIDVAGLTRVEGEGSLRLRVRNGVVEEAHLKIFEAPRYFERLVVGRTPDEVIDIVARICGICPVAYQMTAVHAFEHGLGIPIDPGVRALRRLLYCGEWIESHALHVYLLHLPDFLGYASALELARDDRSTVEAGLPESGLRLPPVQLEQERSPSTRSDSIASRGMPLRGCQCGAHGVPRVHSS